MCGKKTKEELNRLNIKTIGDLAKTDKKILMRHFKSQGEYLYYASRGIDDSKVEVRKSKNQSISVTETLPFNYTNPSLLKEVLFRQTEELARELREKKLFTKTIGVIWKNSSFNSYQAQTTLDNPTDNTKEIIKVVYKIFDENYKEDEIRLIGVKLANLTNSIKEQMSIFDANKVESKEENVQKTIDEINHKFGKSIIRPASLKLIEREKLKK